MRPDDLMASDVALPTSVVGRHRDRRGLRTRTPLAVGLRRGRGRRPLIYLQTVMKGKGIAVEGNDAASRHFVQFSEICSSETYV